MPRPISCDPKTFNYALLKNDISKFTKKEGYSMEYISKNKLLRSKGYLSMVLGKKALPTNLLGPLCEFIGTEASKYKIEPKPEPKEVTPPLTHTPTAINMAPPHSCNTAINLCSDTEIPIEWAPVGWECRIKVDEDFETVMMKVLKNGEEMAISRCYFFSKDDTGIMQAISYAAHQCYKAYQQIALAQQEADRTLRNEAKVISESSKDPNDVRSFKNWILKYKNDTSNIGRLARYCESVYDKLPAHGERKLRMFLQLEKGGNAHVATFNAIWPLYIKEFNAAEREGNMKFANDC